MTAGEFRGALARLGLSQSGLARWMAENGDPRPPKTILRSISNWARGVTEPPGELAIVLRLFEAADYARGLRDALDLCDRRPTAYASAIAADLRAKLAEIARKPG